MAALQLAPAGGGSGGGAGQGCGRQRPARDHPVTPGRGGTGLGAWLHLNHGDGRTAMAQLQGEQATGQAAPDDQHAGDGACHQICRVKERIT